MNVGLSPQHGLCQLFRPHPTSQNSYSSDKLDGCIVWNAYNTVLGEEALLIYIVPVWYAT